MGKKQLFSNKKKGLCIFLIGVLCFFVISFCSEGDSEEASVAETSPYLRYIQAESIDYDSFPVDRVDYTPAGSGTYPGTVYYVATDGSDSNDGQSLTSPFATIQYALEMSQDGDTVRVRGGTYVTGDLTADYEPNRSIHSNFVLAAWQNEKVIIQSANPGQYEYRDALALLGPVHDVIIDGFEFRSFTNTGITFGNPEPGEEPQRNIILKNIIIDGADEAMVTSYSSGGPADKVYIDGLLIKDVILSDVAVIGLNAGQSAVNDFALYRNVHIDRLKISVLSGGSGSGADCLAFENGFNILIENSIVEGAYADGFDLKAQQVAILNCIARHIGRNGVKCWQNAEIINVLSFDTGADANLVMDGGDSLVIRDSVFAYHNAQTGNDSYSFTIAYDIAPTYAGRVEFSRCIFFANTDWGFIPGGADLTFNENVFWAIPTERLFQHSGASPDGYNYADLTMLNAQPWASNNQIVEPGFINPSFQSDNLIRNNLNGDGFKDIALDSYFQILTDPQSVPTASPWSLIPLSFLLGLILIAYGPYRVEKSI